jgi:Pentapeptide repeats (8 copies)
MSDNQGQPISKPVPVWKKSIEVDHKDFTKAVGKAVADLSFGKWDSLAGDGVDAAAALGLSAKAGEIGWWLVYRSLLQAMKKLVDERTELPPERFKPKELKVALDLALENSSLSIDNEFFNHPDQASVVKLIQPAFRDWLIGSGVSEIDAQAISQRFPIYFAEALHIEWGNCPQDYKVLKEKLDTPFTKSNDRAQAWSRYSTWLQKQVEEPLFLEAFSLRQVFVPLRAYYDRKKSEEDLTDPMLRSQEDRLEGDCKTERVVVDLESELFAWLSQPKRDDAIRLISGGPGSGKSSLTKMFAAKLAEQGNILTLFIPLHHFEPSDDLIDAVGKFVKLDGFFNFNPLETEHRGDRLLIIFDGLDELAMQGKVGAKTAQDFVREVQRKVERLNQQTVCVQVLIGGRELVVQANEVDFRKERQILHVLPYLVSPEDRQQYVDPKQLLAPDQRQLWWEYYGKASGSDFTGLPPQLDHGNLNEITAQPLLNYLVALSFRRGAVAFSEKTNLNAVYDDLLKSVYDRGWESNQHVAIHGIEAKDFGRILEEIALASWHGNGRTTTVKDIESHCNHSGLKVLLNSFQKNFQENAQASVTRLLTAFYFRRSGSDSTGEETFEFTHKSFGEYLTAKRIVREVRLIQKKLAARQSDPDEGWDEREALHRWAVLCGSTTMDEYLFKFIWDEVCLQYQIDVAEVATWQQTFCSLIEFMLRQGMPMERLDPRPNYQEEFRQSLNAEDSLLAVLGVFQNITQEISNINYPSPEAFGTLLSRLLGQRIRASNPMSFRCLRYLNLSGCNLIISDLTLADFHKANLSRANLIEANLSGANFVGTNLSGANLREANLRRANLRRANLSGANLSGANLREANLSGVNLSGVNLSGVNLRRANLSGANLSGADLGGANLSGANLGEANLSRANLGEANLSRANLGEANLSGANLSEANLSRANVTQEQLNMSLRT